MVWVKLDDGFFRNPKMRAAGKNGRELYLAALCYSASQLTDGIIPISYLPVLLAEAEVPKSAVNALVQVGAWERSGPSYVIRDFLEFNPSRADVKDQRERKAAAGRKGAQKRWHPGSSSHVTSHSTSNKESEAEAMAPPSPDAMPPSRPVPQDPSRPKDSKSEPFEEDFGRFWNRYPRKDARKDALRAYQARRRDGVSGEDLLLAVGNFADAMAPKVAAGEQQFIMQGKRFLGPGEHWKEFLEGTHQPAGGDVLDFTALAQGGRT